MKIEPYPKLILYHKNDIYWYIDDQNKEIPYIRSYLYDNFWCPILMNDIPHARKTQMDGNNYIHERYVKIIDI